MYKKLLTPFLLLALTSSAWAQNKTVRTFQFESKSGSHTARIVFQTIRFDESKHKVLIDRNNRTIIDGRPAFGTDASVPNVEVISMRLYVDGSEIHVPKHLYVDCYDPNFTSRDLRVRFDRKDPRIVIVDLHGADAAAAYTVRWHLKTKGRHTRSAYQDFSAEG
ncbi:MAG: hypothetical protein ABI791_14070 [Acidobacteriota bacterium]